MNDDDWLNDTGRAFVAVLTAAGEGSSADEQAANALRVVSDLAPRTVLQLAVMLATIMVKLNARYDDLESMAFDFVDGEMGACTPADAVRAFGASCLDARNDDTLADVWSRVPWLSVGAAAVAAAAATRHALKLVASDGRYQ